MQHRSPCEAALDCCEGGIEDCPRCADKVCELHAVDGLCLACQSGKADAEEEGTMNRKQWNLLNNGLATAQTLVRGRIIDLRISGGDAAMYEKWLLEVEEAYAVLRVLGRHVTEEVA